MRHRYFKVDTLGKEAKRIIRDGLQRNRTVPRIQQEVLERTGEHIAERSLSRYARHYRAQMRGRQQACDWVAAATRGAAEAGQPLSAGVQAKLLDVLHEAAREGKLGQMGPYAAGRLALAFADSERKDRDLEIREDKLELEQRRVEMLEERLEVILEKAEKATPSGAEGEPAISPAEAIKEIFGVASQIQT